jgi:hypothetical protein
MKNRGRWLGILLVKSVMLLLLGILCSGLFIACQQGTSIPTLCILTPGRLTSGAMTPSAPKTVVSGHPTSITATPNGAYVFYGWSASPSANAVVANASSPSTTVILSGNATITPIFGLGYSVTYAGNDASGGVPTDSTKYAPEQPLRSAQAPAL